MNMKKVLKSIFLLGIITISFTSCQNEENETNQEEETLSNTSPLTNLLRRVAMNETSDDNIIDSTNCFKVKLPVNLIVNEQPVTINSESDYHLVNDIFEETDTDRDFVDFIFPITIINQDYSEVVVETNAEFESLRRECEEPDPGERNIGCLSVNYPVTIFGYDSNSQLANTYSVRSDVELFLLLFNLNSNEFYAVDYPITVQNSSGETLTINSNAALLAAIQECVNATCPNPNVLTNDLILYIPFANQLRDLTGYSNPTITGNYHYVTDRSGNLNGAFSFDDGTNSALNSVNVQATAVNDLMQTGNFTMSLWFRRQDTSGVNPMEELMNSMAFNIFLGNQTNSAIMGPFLIVNNSTPVTYDNSWIDDNLLGDTENWHHIVVTYQRSNNLMMLYRDGVLRTALTPTDIATTVPSLTFAIRYKGFMDDIRAYKRTLSASEVRTLYNLEGDVNTCLE